MADNSKGGPSLPQVAAGVTLVAGAIAIWGSLGPLVSPPQLKIELSAYSVKVVNATTGDPVAGARIYVVPLPWNSPLLHPNGAPWVWITDLNGEVYPDIVPSWPPNGFGHEFYFVVEKNGFQSTQCAAWIPVGQYIAGQAPFYGSPPR